MKIKDIIRSACLYLDDGETIDYLDSPSGQAAQSLLSKINAYTNFANIVIEELAAGYIPMTYKEDLSASGGKINFADLTFNATRVLNVKDACGKELPFEIYPTFLKVGASECSVEYEYAPANYGLNDTVGFKGEVSATLLSYGLCAEFCVKEGRFEEAVMWRKRYTDGVEKAVLPKNAKVGGRCWL